MPEEGVSLLPADAILSFEEILTVVRTGIDFGIRKVRITGGEPLVRKGVTDLVKMLRVLSDINDLSMTTNGILLSQFALPLAEAGLMRVNISLDTMNQEKYRFTTCGGELSDVLNGIEAVKKAGLNPIKINCVVERSSSEDDALDVAAFGKSMGIEVRFIYRMDLHNGLFYGIEGSTGGQCAICNRLRLTANGKIRPCLFSDLEYDVRALGPEKAFEEAILNKPECGTTNHSGNFYSIGG
ncbi:MAG TPA: radical SAM protein, partial [Bacteroidales bacterium]|nr:radical SAM protein [Bacteroidales bacterium]